MSARAVRVRPARRAHYAEVCRLLAVLDELHRGRLPWLFRDPAGPQRSAEQFAELLTHPDSTVLVAGGRALVGVALVMMRNTPALPVFVPARFGVIDNLVVDPAHRRQGTGAALVRAAERWARARDAAWVELGVYEFNDEARRFYAALGYETVSRKLAKHSPPVA